MSEGTMIGEQIQKVRAEIMAARARRTHIHQRTQKPPLLLFRHTDLRRLRAILRHLSEEHFVHFLNNG